MAPANRNGSAVFPAWIENTQASQAAAPYIGKASTRRRPSIQPPGLGRRRNRLGTKLRTAKGAPRPRPRAAKTSRATAGLWVTAQPIAPAMKGAVHGAATTTASRPVKKAPA